MTIGSVSRAARIRQNRDPSFAATRSLVDGPPRSKRHPEGAPSNPWAGFAAEAEIIGSGKRGTRRQPEHGIKSNDKRRGAGPFPRRSGITPGVGLSGAPDYIDGRQVTSLMPVPSRIGIASSHTVHLPPRSLWCMPSPEGPTCDASDQSRTGSSSTRVVHSRSQVHSPIS